MSPQNYSQPFDWTYALAPNDGNYGLNPLSAFYSTRNPGLEGAQEVRSFDRDLNTMNRKLKIGRSPRGAVLLKARDDPIMFSTQR